MLAEALTAHVDAVFANEAGLVIADAATRKKRKGSKKGKLVSFGSEPGSQGDG